MTMMQQRGFTLIEVVVAFVVFALCAGAVYEVFAGALRRSREAQESELALLTAQSVLAELRARPTEWKPVDSGRNNAGLVWRTEVHPYESEIDPGSAWRPYRVIVSVYADGAAEPRVSLKTIELARVER